MKVRVRKWHIQIAIAIALLSIGDALYLWSAGEKISEVFHGAVEMALLLLLLELVVVIIVEQDEFLVYAQKIIDQSASELMEFEAFTRNEATHPLLGRVGRESIRDFLRAYKFKNRSLKVTGHLKAIESYLVFWSYLAEAQKTTKQGIVVKVVHSLDIAIWNEDKMRVVLDKQEEFVLAGGKITRILMTTGKPEASNFEVARDMMKRGIDVLFVQRSEFEHDFLFVPSLDIAVTWAGTVMARRVQNVEYLVGIGAEEKRDFAEMWEAGRAGATKVEDAFNAA